ncbi:sigma-70 family RNA polymerase sigma factor [soil metagenome]
MNEQAFNKDFVTLIGENKRIIFKIANAYCRNKNDREDLAQDIIYQLWRSWSTYNAAYTFSTWLYRIALNVAISFYRKKKHLSNTISFNNSVMEMEDKNEYPAEMESNIELLQQFIRELKELDKALIILHLEGKTYKEIADILGITETNVATKLSRIKDKLKHKFLLIKQ